MELGVEGLSPTAAVIGL